MFHFLIYLYWTFECLPFLPTLLELILMLFYKTLYFLISSYLTNVQYSCTIYAKVQEYCIFWEKIMKKHMFLKATISIVSIFILTLIINFSCFYREAIDKYEQHIEICVYISSSGECYHSEYCAYIDDCYAIGEEQAKSKGYRRCSFCDGFSIEKICVINSIHIEEENNYPSSLFLSCIIYLSYYIMSKKKKLPN